jgi:hypothetical protein
LGGCGYSSWLAAVSGMVSVEPSTFSTRRPNQRQARPFMSISASQVTT